MVHIKKESKTLSPSPIQDTLERDHNVHIVGQQNTPISQHGK